MRSAYIIRRFPERKNCLEQVEENPRIHSNLQSSMRLLVQIPKAVDKLLRTAATTDTRGNACPQLFLLNFVVAWSDNNFLHGSNPFANECSPIIIGNDEMSTLNGL